MWKRLFGKHEDEPTAARPEDVVEEGGTVMAGPGGAPEPDGTIEERRERDRPDETS
jgi:hypothetical protein